MLAQLHIENYALIDQVNVEFGPGLNVLTGETGAGKSLIIGALGLILGQRAQSDLVRADDKPILVEALFDLSSHPHLHARLKTLGLLLDEPSLLLKRLITRSGSRCYINANLATVAMLQNVGQHLVDILGQHQQHTLLQPEHQLALLDSFGKVSDDVLALGQAYQRYQELLKQYRQLRHEEQQRVQRQELLQRQLQEIAQAQLQADEEERLAQERHLLLNAEKLYGLAQEAYTLLYRADTAILERLGRVLEKLTQLTALDGRQNAMRDEAQQGYYVLETVAQSLRDYSARMEVDPARLQVIEDRLAEIGRLQRKYGPTVAAILQYGDTLRQEQQSWERQSERLQALAQEVSKVRQTVKSLAITLSDKRRQSADRLQQAVQQELRELNMAHAVLRVVHALRRHPQGDMLVGNERVALSAEGIDEVEYLFSSNPGQLPKPLGRIASGGELSRLMLALKSILARQDHVPTLVFDEVDTGIGGRTAKIVGEKLCRIARSHQIFCITHLPQIASYGDQHYRIEKFVQANTTVTQLHTLSFPERIEEIARMSGGKEITETTRKHAEEMLTRHP